MNAPRNSTEVFLLRLFGFRLGIRLEDALVVLETLISKTREWNIPLWIASLDLKKAFDKISFSCIFSALCAQGISDEMVSLLLDLYVNPSALFIKQDAPPAADGGEEQEGRGLRDVGGERVRDRLLEVVEDEAALLHAGLRLCLLSGLL